MDVLIGPEIVTELTFNVQGDFETGHVVEVRDHLHSKPWRVLSKYIFLNIANKTITIPLISKDLCQVKSGNVLCHIQLTPIADVIKNLIKGNIKKHCIIFHPNSIFFLFRRS